jgi:transcription initiation factor IIE alpha subunit
MMEEGKVFKKCSVCRGETAMIYECPDCHSKLCMVCTIRNDWKCPNCKQKLGLAELDS